jgi:hypothetical protein
LLITQPMSAAAIVRGSIISATSNEYGHSKYSHSKQGHAE